MTIEWVVIIVILAVNINHRAIGLNLTAHCRLTLPVLELLQLQFTPLYMCVVNVHMT